MLLLRKNKNINYLLDITNKNYYIFSGNIALKVKILKSKITYTYLGIF